MTATEIVRGNPELATEVLGCYAICWDNNQLHLVHRTTGSNWEEFRPHLTLEHVNAAVARVCGEDESMWARFTDHLLGNPLPLETYSLVQLTMKASAIVKLAALVLTVKEVEE